MDWPLARASSSTVRGACASRSSSSSRRGLANALPISAIASNSAFFRRPISILDYSIDHLITCQTLIPDRRPACTSASCSTTRPPAPPTCSAARAARASRSSIRTSTWSTSTSRWPRRRASPIVAVFETHVQADHVSGLPELVARTGATAYLPAGAGVEFDHLALADGEVVELGNTEVQAIGDARARRAHHAYLVTDHTRADEPWLVLTGDALLVGDAGRPDLHAHGEHTAEDMARALYRSLTERLLTLPDHLVLYPAHYSGSVCGRGLSANPVSTIGFERRHNPALQLRLRGCVRRGAARTTSRRRPRSRPRSSPPTAPDGRVAEPRDASAGPAGAAREPRAVLAAGRRQRVRRRDGRAGALDAAAGRPRGLRPRLERGGAVVHRRVRAREGAAPTSPAGAARERARAPAAADRRLGDRAARCRC